MTLNSLNEDARYYAARRMAFWDLCSHDLYHLARDISTARAEKWVTEADEAVINAVLNYVISARNVAMREHSVRINAFIDANVELERL